MAFAFVTLLVIAFVAVIAYPGIIGALEQVIEGIKLGLHYFACGIWIGIHDRELGEKYKNAKTKEEEEFYEELMEQEYRERRQGS